MFCVFLGGAFGGVEIRSGKPDWTGTGYRKRIVCLYKMWETTGVWLLEGRDDDGGVFCVIYGLGMVGCTKGENYGLLVGGGDLVYILRRTGW